MVKNTVSVTYKEPISIQVGNHLVSKGFILAYDSGHAKSELEVTDSFGILYNDPNAKPKKYFFGLFKEKPNRCFVGARYLNCAGRVLKKKKDVWVLKMYGRKYLLLMKELARRSRFNF